MKIEVNIDKKYFFILLGAILIFSGAIYGYAQDPAIFGHGWNEIEDIPDEATRWANWGDVSDKPSQATRWANWGEIGNMPGGFADGVDNVGSVPTVTFKRYGPYSSQQNIYLGYTWKFCSLGGISTGRENHGAKVWKDGSNWYAGSTGFSDATHQTFWVNCWKFS